MEVNGEIHQVAPRHIDLGVNQRTDSKALQPLLRVLVCRRNVVYYDDAVLFEGL